jgi:metal-sulfur cluster biosynthetic enzyme
MQFDMSEDGPIPQEELEVALGTVLDPCGEFNGTMLSLVDLGMIDRVHERHGHVMVRLFLDDPTCIYFFEITRRLREALTAIAGVREVEFEVKTDEMWTEDQLSERGRARLDEYREERRRLHGGPAFVSADGLRRSLASALNDPN